MKESDVMPHKLLMMYIAAKGDSGNSPSEVDPVIEISDDEDGGQAIVISDDEVIYVSDDYSMETSLTPTKRSKHTHRIPMIPLRSPHRNIVADDSVSIVKHGPGLKQAWYNTAAPYTFKAKVTNCTCEHSVENELLLNQEHIETKREDINAAEMPSKSEPKAPPSPPESSALEHSTDKRPKMPSKSEPEAPPSPPESFALEHSTDERPEMPSKSEPEAPPSPPESSVSAVDDPKLNSAIDNNRNKNSSQRTTTNMGRKFVCDECGKGFKLQSSLYNH